MKKISLPLLLVIIGFIIFNFGNKTTVAKSDLDLVKLATVLKGENILVNGWSLHAREKLENVHRLEEVKDYTGVLKQKFSDWDWTETTDSDHWTAKASFTDKNGFQENIQILSTLTKSNPQTYIIYEVQGEKFDQETDQFLKNEISEKFSTIFRGNTTIFSCIKGEFSDKIDKSLPYTVNNLLKAFQAKKIEALEEETFISTSAYSPLFAESLSSKNKDMNMQLGIRTQGLGAKTTLVVGTPIITIEY